MPGDFSWQRLVVDGRGRVDHDDALNLPAEAAELTRYLVGQYAAKRPACDGRPVLVFGSMPGDGGVLTAKDEIVLVGEVCTLYVSTHKALHGSLFVLWPYGVF